GPAQDGDSARFIQKVCQFPDLSIRRADDWRRLREAEPRPFHHSRLQSNIPRQNHHGNAATRDGGLHGDFQHSRRVLGMGDELSVMSALSKRDLGLGFLKIAASNLCDRNLRGYRQDWNPTAVGVVESIDQVCVSRSAAPVTYRQLSCQMCFRSRSKGCAFLMPDVDPT